MRTKCRVCGRTIDELCTVCRDIAAKRALADLRILYAGEKITAPTVRDATWKACGAVFQEECIQGHLDQMAKEGVKEA